MRQRISALVLIAVLIGLDQITKAVATAYLQTPLVIWDGVLELTYTQNPGAAWGMLAGGRWILVAITVAIVLALLVLLLCGRMRHPLLWVASSLLIAGGIGNLIDRIGSGLVVDFIYVRLIRFPVFNFADCCVCIGAVLLLLYLLFFDSRLRGKERDGDGTKELDGPDRSRRGEARQVSVGDDGRHASDGAEVDGTGARDGERGSAE